MAQPHQYHGEGGAAPVWPGEGTTSYRDSYRPDPFPLWNCNADSWLQCRCRA